MTTATACASPTSCVTWSSWVTEALIVAMPLLCSADAAVIYRQAFALLPAEDPEDPASPLHRLAAMGPELRGWADR